MTTISKCVLALAVVIASIAVSNQILGISAQTDGRVNIQITSSKQSGGPNSNWNFNIPRSQNSDDASQLYLIIGIIVTALVIKLICICIWYSCPRCRDHIPSITINA